MDSLRLAPTALRLLPFHTAQASFSEVIQIYIRWLSEKSPHHQRAMSGIYILFYYISLNVSNIKQVFKATYNKERELSISIQ